MVARIAQVCVGLASETDRPTDLVQLMHTRGGRRFAIVAVPSGLLPLALHHHDVRARLQIDVTRASATRADDAGGDSTTAAAEKATPAAAAEGGATAPLPWLARLRIKIGEDSFATVTGFAARGGGAHPSVELVDLGTRQLAVPAAARLAVTPAAAAAGRDNNGFEPGRSVPLDHTVPTSATRGPELVAAMPVATAGVPTLGHPDLLLGGRDRRIRWIGGLG